MFDIFKFVSGHSGRVPHKCLNTMWRCMNSIVIRGMWRSRCSNVQLHAVSKILWKILWSETFSMIPANPIGQRPFAGSLVGAFLHLAKGWMWIGTVVHWWQVVTSVCSFMMIGVRDPVICSSSFCDQATTLTLVFSPRGSHMVVTAKKEDPPMECHEIQNTPGIGTGLWPPALNVNARPRALCPAGHKQREMARREESEARGAWP